MDYYPLFAQLQGRACLLVGGGEVASRKGDALLKAGAVLHIVAPEISTTLQEAVSAGQAHWIGPVFDPVQLDEVWLVIAATDNPDVNDEVYQAATARRLFVNVVDDQPRCSFIVPSLVDRGPLQIAMSTGGRAPVLARLIRQKLETLIPQSTGRLLALAGRLRQTIKQQLTDVTERRRFYEQLLEGPVARLVAAGRDQEAEQSTLEALSAHRSQGGEVWLVGAGPGDPELLTLRALQLMQAADVVLYDRLVSAEILELCRRDAERFSVGKVAGHHTVPQPEINDWLIRLAQQGKRVLRLKGGDPFIFGRGGEEAQSLVEAQVPFQVVPGITAASGATAYAGIPLTHRDYSQTVQFVTGHGRVDGDPMDWPLLAKSRQTLVIYMGTLKAEAITTALIEHGRDPSTPVAIISRGTRADQTKVVGTLQGLPELAAQPEVTSPSLIIVGEVVALHQQLDWFGGAGFADESLVAGSSTGPSSVS